MGKGGSKMVCKNNTYYLNGPLTTITTLIALEN
jgi:hypothetical protein